MKTGSSASSTAVRSPELTIPHPSEAKKNPFLRPTRKGGSLARWIAGGEEPALYARYGDACVHVRDAIDDRLAEGAETFEEDLGVERAAKRDPGGLELGPELGVVRHLPVEDDGEAVLAIGCAPFSVRLRIASRTKPSFRGGAPLRRQGAEDGALVGTTVGHHAECSLRIDRAGGADGAKDPHISGPREASSTHAVHPAAQRLEKANPRGRRRASPPTQCA